MIIALLITIVIEGSIDILYCWYKKKPWVSVVMTGLGANLCTQMGLWAVLRFLQGAYLVILIGTEILIWFAEWLCFTVVSHNQLNAREAMLLSLLRNLTSFGIGLILPV